jgi:hypothetical protein
MHPDGNFTKEDVEVYLKWAIDNAPSGEGTVEAYRWYGILGYQISLISTRKPRKRLMYLCPKNAAVIS